tara:strand:+ start:286 stop:513 length:228 start_codon:yes stop_codon:yes gene_type:complete
MKDKYYKTISPNTAKNRIAKLVEASRQAWHAHLELKEIKGIDRDSHAYQHSLTTAITYSQALRAMGIVEIESLAE